MVLVLPTPLEYTKLANLETSLHLLGMRQLVLVGLQVQRIGTIPGSFKAPTAATLAFGTSLKERRQRVSESANIAYLVLIVDT